MFFVTLQRAIDSSVRRMCDLLEVYVDAHVKGRQDGKGRRRREEKGIKGGRGRPMGGDDEAIMMEKMEG